MSEPKGSSEAMTHAEVIRKALFRSSLPNTIYDPAIMALEALETQLEVARAETEEIRAAATKWMESEDAELVQARAQLAERDREIERLNGIVQSQAFLKECAETPLMRDVLSQLSASQAREREAVERAERAEHNWHWVFETLGIPKEADGSLDLDKAQPVLSALAAARKALNTAMVAMEERRAYVNAGDPATCWQEMKYGKTWDAEDAEVSAALERINGERHE